jgi:hypothetical protein
MKGSIRHTAVTEPWQIALVRDQIQRIRARKREVCEGYNLGIRRLRDMLPVEERD